MHRWLDSATHATTTERSFGILAIARPRSDADSDSGRTLNGADWAEARRLFDEALLLPPAERGSYLDAECDDPAVRAEVNSLLHSLDEAEGFLSAPAVAVQDEAPPDEALVDPNERAGPYRFIKSLGRGGMGSVYLAARDDDVYRKEVAVKVLRAGLDTEDLVNRFRRERQILANLDHPHISRMLDGGSTSEGRPYLVMEHIDGTPIDQYCDEQMLTVEQRIRLFLKVCDAVHFAHQNLVVHRDLKPANILVTGQDEPHLLDFGIAKLLQTDDFPQTVEPTVPGQTPMTPEYASPEQVKGDAITTATDVYSLGVILYRLLTGHRPYRLPSRRRADVELAVCESRPQRPSSAILRSIERAGETLTPQDVANARRADPKKLGKSLAGDLDNIVLQALRKDPRQRYGSVEQLASDLQAYLDGRPVSAVRDSLLYRSGKFLRRHRFAVGIGTAVLTFLVGLSSTLLLQRRTILEERNHAEAVSEAMVEFFGIPDPTRARGETITAREVLDRISSRIDHELQSQPRLKARLLETMGRTYHQLGLYPEAVNRLQQALRLRQATSGTMDLGVAECLHLLAETRAVDGQYDLAERDARQALAIRRELFDAGHPLIAKSLAGLAGLLKTQGDFDTAQAYFQEAEELARQTDSPEVLADLLDDFAVLHNEMGNYEQSERLQRESLDLQEELFGELHPKTAISLNNLALTVQRRGDLQQAELLLRRAIEQQRRLFDGAHGDLANTLNSLALLLDEQGHYDEAKQLLDEVLTMQREVYGEDHPRIATTVNNIADVFFHLGDYESAEKMYRESLQRQRRIFGEDHPGLAVPLNDLANVETKLGRHELAEAGYRQALALSRQLGPRHPQVAVVLGNLGQLLTQRGDTVSPLAMYREALSIKTEALGEDHPEVSIALYNLANLQKAANDFAGARASLRRAIDISLRGLGEDHVRVAQLHINLASVELAAQQPNETVRLAKSALQRFDALLPAGNEWSQAAERLLGCGLAASGQHGAAEPLLLASYQSLAAKTPGSESMRIVLEHLVEMYERSRRPAEGARFRAQLEALPPE